VQDSGKADLSSESFPGEGAIEKGSRGAVKKHLVHEGLVVENQRVELMGKGDDEMKIVGGEESFQSLFNPPNLVQSLALGAMAIAA